MGTAHKRKKQPEHVRRSLLDEAARLLVANGIASVTVQAVSEAAGVSKGGFMHHFPHKRGLIDALCDEVLDALGADLEARTDADPEPHGAFTRAYVESMFSFSSDGSYNHMWVLSVLMLTEAELRKKWAEWFNAQLKKHLHTDGGAELAIVRMAADGVWLADLSGTDLPEREVMQVQLIAATRPRS